VRDPRPLKDYDRPDIPTLDELLDELGHPRRRFLVLAGAGALAVAGGGLLAACNPGNDDDDSGGGDDDSAPGDDDDDDSTPWDDDDGGIDDDDDSEPMDCRLPQKGAHQATIGGGDMLTYTLNALVTDWSVVSYLHDNEALAFEVLDAVLAKVDCATLPDVLGAVQKDMAAALTDLIRDVGGLTCSVYQVDLYVDDCVPAP